MVSVEQSEAGRTTGRAPATELLEEIVRRVVEVAQPEQIVLFGSAARGEMGPDSDIDLLVLKRDVPQKRQLAIKIRRALRGIPEASDIVVATPEELSAYKQSPSPAFGDAVREGQTLYAA